MPVFQSRDIGIDNAAGIPGLQSLFVFVTAKYYILIAILCRLSGYSDGPSADTGDSCVPALTASRLDELTRHVLSCVAFSPGVNAA